MNALAYLHEHGLEAESLPGDRIAVWPGEAITPYLERWIAEHKPEIVSELRKSAAPAEKKNQNPDAILLKVAEQLQASPAILRALLDSDDMQDIAEGVISRAHLLAYFRQMYADRHPLTLPNPTN